MSRLQAYPLDFSDNRLKYRFISVGTDINIVKLVRYDYYRTSLWNLSFGDANSNQTDFDDTVITDNGDMRKVMQTIFQTSLMFTDKYPDRKIFIQPVDKKRKVFYNRIFQQKHKEIEKYFTIEGQIIGEIEKENYDSDKIYDTFIVTRREDVLNY